MYPWVLLYRPGWFRIQRCSCLCLHSGMRAEPPHPSSIQCSSGSSFPQLLTSVSSFCSFSSSSVSFPSSPLSCSPPSPSCFSLFPPAPACLPTAYRHETPCLGIFLRALFSVSQNGCHCSWQYPDGNISGRKRNASFCLMLTLKREESSPRNLPTHSPSSLVTLALHTLI